MKPTTLIFLLTFSLSAFSQEVRDTVAITDTIPTDARPRNAYGGLMDDDPVYNRRYPWTTTAARVAFTNVVNWSIARYVFNYEWARISPQVWRTNLKNGFKWDDDRFGVNFIGHPHTGNYYFNTARSNGYSFWGSYPFAIGGSLMWEFFGENTSASKNDIINTPISGAFLGEVFYRISSNILNDRKRGRQRVFRELLAGIVNPPRAFNRFTQGKMFRVVQHDVYQKEPLNILFSAGLHKVNDKNKFGSGSTNAILNLQFDYGDPFEVRRRKAFDVFRLRLEARYGDNTKLIDNVLGYGLLFGKTYMPGKHGLLFGLFQQFDYWNNNIFEIGSLGFGPGVISRIHLGTNSRLYTGLHFAAVPLAGNSTRFGPDTSEFRDYPFGGGFEGRIEERLNIGRWLSLGFNGYYYWIYNYEGSSGKSRIGIIKPSVTVKLFRNVSIGAEHHVFYDNRFLENNQELHLRRTEQKFFLQIFFEDKERRGMYH